MEKMSRNPNFDNIPDSEKRIIAYPVAIATAVLEDFGFRNLLKQEGLVNGIVGRALLKSNKNTTSKTFAEFIRKDLKNLMAQEGKSKMRIAATQGGLILGAGAATEFETGALQSVAELSSTASELSTSLFSTESDSSSFESSLSESVAKISSSSRIISFSTTFTLFTFDGLVFILSKAYTVNIVMPEIRPYRYPLLLNRAIKAVKKPKI